MNPALSQLLPAMVSYVTEHGGYVTKTKLLKLLYLCDVEYYRVHRKTLTGFEWKFFHLGPWAREFDTLLEELTAQGTLLESVGSRPEFDTKFYRTPEPYDLDRLFASYREQWPVKIVLDRWGGSSTAEILDYVYFHTEPVEHGIRHEPLDFTRIPEQTPPAYVRQASGKTVREIQEMRSRFRQEMARKKQEAKKEFQFTAPRYDEEFFTALAKLDETNL
jgi:hypothetical protein